MIDPRLLQLSDSAFPTGAFAHSFGIEGLVQLGLLRGADELPLRLEELIWHLALGALPFLNDAYSGDPVAADHAAEAFLSNHVANRASRAQGRSFLLAAEATFADARVAALRERLPHSHVAVATGAALAVAGIALDDARQLFLFAGLRGAISAAVRLGVVGPLRAQRVLYLLHPVTTTALQESRALTSANARSTAPLLEAAQAAHDRLYSRLFQS